jgi:hypothetical protein
MANKALFYKGELAGMVQVDDEDAHLLDKPWVIDFCNLRKGQKGKYFRVKRRTTKAEQEAGMPGQIKIHKEVFEKHFGPVPEGYLVDHIDRDTFNNRKSNLRLLTHGENVARRKGSKIHKGEQNG